VKFIFLSWILLLSLLIPAGAAAQDTVQGYISKYAQLSTQMMLEYGIPASLILSVAYVESGGGNSRNCRLLHNHFGIKAGKRYYIPGTKHLTAYKNYASDTLSFRDFCETISRKKLYPELKGNMDYTIWVKRIAQTGYASAHSIWKKKILNTIKKFNLEQFDQKQSPWIQEVPPHPPEKQ